MKKRNNRSGFTLLEIIIVIIIVGVLASLALPRLFKVVETSRGGEALNNASALRGSIARCHLKSNDYSLCDSITGELDLDSPNNAAGSHFTYSITATLSSFTIVATRNTRAGVVGGDIIWIMQTPENVTKGGTSAFTGI